MSFVELDIPQRLPSRNAAAALHQHIIEQISRLRPSVGDTLLPAEELAVRFGVSRSTMNRVLDGLQREGWIERRAGCGNFVGIRAGSVSSMESRPRAEGKGRQFRLAVAIFPWGDEGGWLGQGLLEGLDIAVQDENIALELIGRGEENCDRFARRLAQSHPNALIILKPTISSAPMIREAERLGIPCVLTGARLREIGHVTVQEDGAQGVSSAVQYLVERGHRQIGLILPDEPSTPFYDRRHGYLNGLTQAGLPIDQNLIFWAPDRQCTGLLAAYLERNRPTAVIMGSGSYLHAFTPLVESGRISIPRDLSVIAFDQVSQQFAPVIGGLMPTMIELPMKQMAAEVVRLVRQMLMGQETPKITSVPCRIIDGDTVLSMQNK